MEKLRINSKIIKFITIIFLAVIDQMTKIIIDRYFLDYKFDIIKGIVGFKPYLNADYSWLNSLFKLGVGLRTHIIFTIIALSIIIIVYDFIKYKVSNLLIIDFMFINLISGSICSLTDKVFWGGSLDFIWLKGFFIFDIKDVYISIFEVTTVILVVKNFRTVNDFRMKELFEYVAKKIKLYRQ